MEAGSLQERADSFTNETDIPLSYIVIVFEGTDGRPPNPAVAELYWDAIGSPDFPVVADTEVASLASTGFNGVNLAGKCLISPQMALLACTTGHGPDDWATDIIVEREG